MPTRVLPNLIARSLVEKFVPKYKAILEEMQRNDEKLKVGGQKYVEHQLSWFGKKYDEENNITITGISKEEKEFVSFLEFYSMNETEILVDEQEVFSKKFTQLHDQAFSRQERDKKRDYKLNKMNKILTKYNMNYAIESHREKSGDKKTYWKVVEFNRASTELKSE